MQLCVYLELLKIFYWLLMILLNYPTQLLEITFVLRPFGRDRNTALQKSLLSFFCFLVAAVDSTNLSNKLVYYQLYFLCSPIIST